MSGSEQASRTHSSGCRCNGHLSAHLAWRVKLSATAKVLSKAPEKQVGPEAVGVVAKGELRDHHHQHIPPHSRFQALKSQGEQFYRVVGAAALLQAGLTGVCGVLVSCCASPPMRCCCRATTQARWGKLQAVVSGAKGLKRFISARHEAEEHLKTTTPTSESHIRAQGNLECV